MMNDNSNLQLVTLSTIGATKYHEVFCPENAWGSLNEGSGDLDPFPFPLVHSGFHERKQTPGRQPIGEIITVSGTKTGPTKHSEIVSRHIYVHLEPEKKGRPFQVHLFPSAFRLTILCTLLSHSTPLPPVMHVCTPKCPKENAAKKTSRETGNPNERDPGVTTPVVCLLLPLEGGSDSPVLPGEISNEIFGFESI